MTEREIDKLDFPRLVSYPRTGSHWLRILLECYLRKPTAPTSFIPTKIDSLERVLLWLSEVNKSNISSRSITEPTFTKIEKINDGWSERVWGLHLHNRQIHIKQNYEGPLRNLEKVIYLYRDPVDTIWSQMKYYPESLLNEIIIEYRDHLDVWLNNKNKSKEICYITYEGLKKAPNLYFKKVIDFLGYEWNRESFELIYPLITIRMVELMTSRGKDVAIIHYDTELKKRFREKYYKKIYSHFPKLYSNTWESLCVKHDYIF
jgi:hypothetical protein